MVELASPLRKYSQGGQILAEDKDDHLSPLTLLFGHVAFFVLFHFSRVQS